MVKGILKNLKKKEKKEENEKEELLPFNQWVLKSHLALSCGVSLVLGRLVCIRKKV